MLVHPEAGAPHSDVRVPAARHVLIVVTAQARVRLLVLARLGRLRDDLEDDGRGSRRRTGTGTRRDGGREATSAREPATSALKPTSGSEAAELGVVVAEWVEQVDHVTVLVPLVPAKVKAAQVQGGGDVLGAAVLSGLGGSDPLLLAVLILCSKQTTRNVSLGHAQ